MSDVSVLVNKLWSFCHVLRDDGLSYQDYLEQLTFLLFLKMADERAALTGEPSPIPDEHGWARLASNQMTGEKLEAHYRATLRELGRRPGMLGLIFRRAQAKIQDPAKLRQLIVELIGKEEWSSLSADVKGDAYEGLLERNAQDVKGGTGQYFTPRPVIGAIVDVMRPTADDTIVDPAAGTGGFLLAAHGYITGEVEETVEVDGEPVTRRRPRYRLTRDQKRRMRYETLRGVELVAGVARLCAMNLYLHGIGPHGHECRAHETVAGCPATGPQPCTPWETPVEVRDALLRPHGSLVSMVLTNPPFGKKSSVTVVNADGKADKKAVSYSRDYFYATTSNKQLNFVQHVVTMLAVGGRAAVVVPDNVLFEGGAGETVRKRLLAECDVHTLLRLPTGIFYAQGVKANVLFFDRAPASKVAATRRLWVYDLRTNQHFTLKQNRMTRADLEDFVRCYQAEDRSRRVATWSEETPEGRWRAYDYDELVARDKLSLDLFWLRDESLEAQANLPPPHVLAQEIADDLESALAQIRDILGELEERAGVGDEAE